jgi:hypothetical protein
MCMACQEMELFYAYLDAIEEEKRKAQPWQCEVTIVAPADADAAPASTPVAGQSALRPKPGFVCDDPE